MPVVPRRGVGYVSQTQTPTVSPGNAFRPPEPVDIAPASKEIADLVEKHQAEQDQNAVLDADNQLSALSTQLEVQTLQKRGKDAIGSGPQVQEQWTKASSDIENNLTNDRQKEAFRIRSAHHFQMLNDTVQTHEATETQNYGNDTIAATIENSRNLAVKHVDDPTIINQAVTETRDLGAELGRRNGWSPEMIQARQTQDVSKIHSDVIDLLLSNDQDIDAAKYFAAHSNEMAPEALLRANAAVDLGSLRGESQRSADDITSQSATLGGALQAAQKITDPKLREATEWRIRRYYEDQATDDRQQRQQAYQDASSIIAQTGDIYKVPPAMMQKLSASEQIELQHLVAQKRNPERATNWNTYSKLLNMAGLNDSTRQQFEQLDLSKYRNDLSDQAYEHLLTLQLGERRQTAGGLSTEDKRQAAIAERDARKQADRDKAREMLRSMGADVPEPPRAPGAPLRTPTTQLKALPKGRQVPQGWVDRASKDENYKRYLEHMGVVFDSAFSAPATRGDINLR